MSLKYCFDWFRLQLHLEKHSFHCSEHKLALLWLAVQCINSFADFVQFYYTCAPLPLLQKCPPCKFAFWNCFQYAEKSAWDAASRIFLRNTQACPVWSQLPPLGQTHDNHTLWPCIGPLLGPQNVPFGGIGSPPSDQIWSQMSPRPHFQRQYRHLR